MPKEDLLKNYGYAVISQKHHSTTFVKEDKDVERMLFAHEIDDGDIILKLSPENVRVAKLQNYIELS